MMISGLQKLTLLDFPQKVACTVFLGGCNLRCPFCQNGEILDGRTAGMTEDDFFAFLKKRQKILDGVCVSGRRAASARGDFFLYRKNPSARIRRKTGHKRNFSRTPETARAGKTDRLCGDGHQEFAKKICADGRGRQSILKISEKARRF